MSYDRSLFLSVSINGNLNFICNYGKKLWGHISIILFLSQANCGFSVVAFNSRIIIVSYSFSRTIGIWTPVLRVLWQIGDCKGRYDICMEKGLRLDYFWKLGGLFELFWDLTKFESSRSTASFCFQVIGSGWAVNVLNSGSVAGIPNRKD